MYYHNVTGPAVVYGFVNEWWFGGVQYSFDVWCRLAGLCDSDRERLYSVYC